MTLTFHVDSVSCDRFTVSVRADNKDDLQRLLFGFYIACKQFDVRISTSKQGN